MSTLLEITNKVLLRLREDEVTALTDAYPALIAGFVADITEEANEATIWNALDHEIDVTVVASTIQYALTGTTLKSMLLFDPQGDPHAWIFDSSTDRYGFQMEYLDPSEYQRRYQMDRGLTHDKPQWFTVEKDTTNDSLVIKLWPTPSSSKYVRIRFNTPEAELSPATDAAVEIKMPDRVVRLGALYLALNERGEEMGEPGSIMETRYRLALAAAVEEEVRQRERTGYYDWVRN